MQKAIKNNPKDFFKPTRYKIFSSIIITVCYFLLFVPFLNLVHPPDPKCLKTYHLQLGEKYAELCTPQDGLLVDLPDYISKWSIYRDNGYTIDLNPLHSWKEYIYWNRETVLIFISSYLFTCSALFCYKKLNIGKRKNKNIGVEIIMLYVAPLIGIWFLIVLFTILFNPCLYVACL